MRPARAPVGAALALVLAACGQVDFATRPDAAAARPDATTDAAAAGPDAMPTGPVAAYPLDDPDGPVNDGTGHGLDAVCAGGCPARLAVGRVGAARTFTGGGEHLEVEDPRLALSTGFTVAAFVRQPVANNVGTVLAKPHASGVGAAFELALAGGETWFCTRPDASVGDEECLVAAPLAVDRWVHVAMTWDGATKRLFLDGAVAAEAAGVTTFDSGPLVLGADAENGLPVTTPFVGDLDEVQLFDRALGPAEVAALAAR